VVPRVRITVQRRSPGVFEFVLAVDKATVPEFPTQCAGRRPITTRLGTRFAIDDGVNLPVEVDTIKSWRCLDLIRGDPLKPQSLRLP
jgi:hypothetical protein